VTRAPLSTDQQRRHPMKNWYEIKAAADGEAAEVYIYA
jgi:hypothetical protein